MSDVDTMSELHIQRVGAIDDTSSMGGQSFLEINNMGLDGKSSGGGSFMVVGGNQSENSYTGTETGVVKVGGQKQANDWESSSDYTDIQITGGQQFDLNSSFVSETSVQMGEIPSIRPNNSTSNRLESFQEGDSDEEDFDSLKETDEERARREQKQATLHVKPSVYVNNGKCP